MRNLRNDIPSNGHYSCVRGERDQTVSLCVHSLVCENQLLGMHITKVDTMPLKKRGRNYNVFF